MSVQHALILSLKAERAQLKRERDHIRAFARYLVDRMYELTEDNEFLRHGQAKRGDIWLRNELARARAKYGE